MAQTRLTRQQRLTTIDLVVPKDNPPVRDAMFSILIGQRWAMDLDIAIDNALENGNFFLMDDDSDLEDFE